jgi:asparagine synthase (glutamine-hydrolysing)
MCGICGFISKENIGFDKLKAMNDTMYHRGPNDSGEEIFESVSGYNVGMAHRRLSILDLSPLGHQPYLSNDKSVVLVFNGEIYNYLELKEKLSDYPFKSSCDTEVILAAYLKWGIKGIERLNGMFAIAIYDRNKEEVYLCRDRIGKKPLYYWNNNGSLVFGSELKPIMKAFEYMNITKTINKKVLSRYIYQQYITSPDTVFENVYQVETGTIVSIKIQENLTVNRYKYWDINTIYHQKKGTGPKNFEEAKSELKSALEKAVRNRMVADVPIGTFLSGGYDSSLITAVAQSISDRPVKTFCVGFNDERYNEAKYAKEVSKHLGTDHTEFYIGEDDMLRLVDSIPKYYDEPFADSSQIATMLVSELARKDVTVALSGDGGDEFFCGYNIYKKIEQARKLDLLGALAHGVGRIGNLEERYPFKLRVISQNRNKEAKTQFIAGNNIKVANNMIKVSGARPCFYDWESRYNENNWQERRMLLDMDTYLPSDILCKVDRASMKYSLETRCPILDKEVMELSFSLPHEFKYKNGIKKYILKELAYDYIPRRLLERPKTGFSVPVDKWLRGPLKSRLLDYTNSEFLSRQCIFEAEYTSKFIENYLKKGDMGSGSGENYSRTIWAVFVFQQWYEAYMKEN